MDGAYDFGLVALSVAVASLAALSTFGLAGRVGPAEPRAARWWPLGGVVALGTGIWSMHFVGMPAFKLPIARGYSGAGHVEHLRAITCWRRQP